MLPVNTDGSVNRPEELISVRHGNGLFAKEFIYMSGSQLQVSLLRK